MVRRQARLARQLDKPRPKKRRLRDEAAAKTLKRNREGVLNGYKLNKTNATAGGAQQPHQGDEADEPRIKTFKRMRRCCLLSLGYMRIIKRGIRLNGVKFEDLRL